MHTNPKENRPHPDFLLIEQFRHKGYHCLQLEEENSFIFIFTHDKNPEQNFDIFWEEEEKPRKKYTIH
jgi:hypothetical protein